MMQIGRHVAGTLLHEAEMTREPVGHVHVFSLEMTADDLLTINLASVTQYSADQIRRGAIGHARGNAARETDAGKAWLDYEADAKALGRLPIIIDDAANMDLPGLVMRARATKRASRTRLICIDFRDLVRRGQEQSRMHLPEWIPYLGYALKALAKTTNCPVLALAQINKTKSGEMPVRPTLDDLPYDGGQAADGVFALHRPEIYMPSEPPRTLGKRSSEQDTNAKTAWEAQRAKVRGLTEFLALKRRFGPTGEPVRLRFNGPRMTLADWDAPQTHAPAWSEPPDWEATEGNYR